MIGISSRIDGPIDETEVLQQISREFRKFLRRISRDLDEPGLTSNTQQATLAREKIGDITYCLLRFPPVPKKKLTLHQKRIALLVAEGFSNGDIARQLKIKPSTVAAHISRIYGKLNIDSRVALTRYSMLIT